MSKSAIAGLKSILSTGEHADVHFLLGDGDAKERVPAHKFILKNASNVFAAMFRFDSQNANAENDFANGPTDVEIPDVEAAAFKVMLSFIYMDDLSGLNGDNAMAVLCAAKKYNIPGLVDPSLQIPISELRNVFVAYAYACLFDLEDFANCCLSYIDKNADILIKSEEFLQIDQKTLCEIFGRDEFQIHEEITIWKACRQNGIECSAENRRAVLGPALFKIRFPLLSSEEFAKDIVQSGVLTTQEVIGVQQHKIKPNYDQFNSEERIRTFGTITMDIEKVSEFAGADVRSCRFSKTVHIKGLPWQIVAQITTDGTGNEKWLGISLLCDAQKEDPSWSCKCSATVRIISQKNWAENSVGTLCDHVFCNKSNNWGFGNFISFEKLMDHSNGFYDREEDKVTLAIDVTVKDEKMDKFIWDQNKLKWTLSMEIENFSEFAREIIGSERKSETVYINGIAWEIVAQINPKIMRHSKPIGRRIYNEKWLGIYLLCVGPKNDKHWSCKCSLNCQILSQKSGVADYKKGPSKSQLFFSDSNGRGFSNFASFAELMDPSNGFYNQNEDKVTLAIDFTVKDENPMIGDYFKYADSFFCWSSGFLQFGN
ncbi:hypothetical protein niasHT_036926 [Heterodera trifolii]|uniref:BTB domain-containing protein n=1 Tax=Heterodera trifolii TaxID=157864 RepID=A0ABD2IFC8_9BILA